VPQDLHRDPLRGVDGGGEADALRAWDDRGRDADRPPRELTSGPPELPGLSAASVCSTSSIRRPVCERRLRPSALTTPAVTVCWKP
jgi:hypothetical protein